ncbi:MAG: retropepsin-like aspartic protease [Longimicrobiales bacterium]
MTERISRILGAGMLLVLGLSPCAVSAQAPELLELYEDRTLHSVLDALPDSMFDQLSLEEQLLHLRAEARGARGYHAVEQIRPLLAAHRNHPAVLATAAVVHHAAGRLDEAARLARAALDLDPGQVAAWRADAMLRLHRHDPVGALASFREARRADPSRVGSFWDVLFGQSIAEGLGEAAVRADALEARAAVHEAAGHPDRAGDARERAALSRLVSGLPLFTAETDADVVVVPFDACFDGTPYRCVDVHAGGERYRVLIDSGNEYGFGVHSGALQDALATYTGGATSVTTGSVDTALVARDFFADRVDFGGLTLRHVPAVASPKIREPYWDANLNPFFIRHRVVTLDYVTGRMIVRTRARFDRDLATADHPVARVPMYDPDRPYIMADVNGRRATAVIETGAEVLSLTAEFAEHAGLPLRDGTRQWRDRVLDVRRTDANVTVGGVPFFRDSVEAWPGRVGDLCTGLLYDVVIGPGSLEGRFSLSYDPIDRVVILERGPAAGVGP